MKSTMKKICALVLATIMTIAMVTCVSAATLTVTDVDGNAKATSTFSAYRVFEWQAEEGDDLYTAIKPTADFKAFFEEHTEYTVLDIAELKAEIEKLKEQINS